MPPSRRQESRLKRARRYGLRTPLRPRASDLLARTGVQNDTAECTSSTEIVNPADAKRDEDAETSVSEESPEPPTTSLSHDDALPSSLAPTSLSHDNALPSSLAQPMDLDCKRDDAVVSDSGASDPTQCDAFLINGKLVARDSLVTLRVLGKGDTCIVTEVRAFFSNICAHVCACIKRVCVCRSLVRTAGSSTH